MGYDQLPCESQAYFFNSRGNPVTVTMLFSFKFVLTFRWVGGSAYSWFIRTFTGLWKEFVNVVCPIRKKPKPLPLFWSIFVVFNFPLVWHHVWFLGSCLFQKWWLLFFIFCPFPKKKNLYIVKLQLASLVMGVRSHNSNWDPRRHPGLLELCSSHNMILNVKKWKLINIDLERYMHSHVQCSTVDNTQDIETT